jgi:hypothetical protein
MGVGLLVQAFVMAPIEGVETHHVMQALYLRLNKTVPWVLVRRTKSVADAEALAHRVAKEKKRGRLLYVEALDLPTDIWDFRELLHRRLGGWMCKALLPGYRRIRQGGRTVWKKCHESQLNLFT